MYFDPAGINVLEGKNGTGKSAVVVAIELACGNTCIKTGRYPKSCQMVRDGEKVAIVRVTFSNSGRAGFQQEVYGDTIAVQRTMFSNEEKSNKYALLNHEQKVKSSKKESILEVLAHFQIRPNNPIVILNQTDTRDLLSSEKNGKNKILAKGILEGSRLQGVQEKYDICERKLQGLCKSSDDQKVDLEEKKEEVKNMRTRLVKMEKEFQELGRKTNFYHAQTEGKKYQDVSLLILAMLVSVLYSGSLCIAAFCVRQQINKLQVQLKEAKGKKKRMEGNLKKESGKPATAPSEGKDPTDMPPLTAASSSQIEYSHSLFVAMQADSPPKEVQCLVKGAPVVVGKMGGWRFADQNRKDNTKEKKKNDKPTADPIIPSSLGHDEGAMEQGNKLRCKQLTDEVKKLEEEIVKKKQQKKHAEDAGAQAGNSLDVSRAIARMNTLSPCIQRKKVELESLDAEVKAKEGNAPEMEEFIVKAKKELEQRKLEKTRIQESIQKGASTRFTEVLRNRGMSGRLELDFQNKELKIVMFPSGSDENSEDDGSDENSEDGGSDENSEDGISATALSGGERTSTMVAVFLAFGSNLKTPFQIIDEPDIFVDPASRKKIYEEIVSELR